jgi:ribosomal protein L31
MKPDIHPATYDLTLVLTTGKERKVKSASDCGRLQLDSDFNNHPAWTGNISQLNEKASQVAKFNKRFAAITSFGNDKQPD